MMSSKKTINIWKSQVMAVLLVEVGERRMGIVTEKKTKGRVQCEKLEKKGQTGGALGYSF
jgi:hypothetical protein